MNIPAPQSQSLEPLNGKNSRKWNKFFSKNFYQGNSHGQLLNLFARKAVSREAKRK
jgi:hypothetical protein